MTQMSGKRQKQENNNTTKKKLQKPTNQIELFFFLQMCSFSLICCIVRFNLIVFLFLTALVGSFKNSFTTSRPQ